MQFWELPKVKKNSTIRNIPRVRPQLLSVPFPFLTQHKRLLLLVLLVLLVFLVLLHTSTLSTSTIFTSFIKITPINYKDKACVYFCTEVKIHTALELSKSSTLHLKDVPRPSRHQSQPLPNPSPLPFDTRNWQETWNSTDNQACRRIHRPEDSQCFGQN